MAQTMELHTTAGGGTEPRAPGPDPLIGQHLLHYSVVEVIGQGGMSVVYRGRDERLQRDVAIKVLHPFLAEKPECRLRLAREARAVARLEHPHILKVFDFSGEPSQAALDVGEHGPQNGQRVNGYAEGFIIAELVRGVTLKRFAEVNKVWRCPEVGAMAIWQVAKALEHAHANGVVHRDLKPENVMVREDGWLKLMDFGIAQIADQKGLTITGTLLGSPAHMAPECIDGHPADERSDLFSLGTVLYWLCTGALPFDAHSPHALLKQIVEGRQVPAQQKSSLVSDELSKLIAKALATKPSERYETAGALVAALDDVLTRAGLPPSTDTLKALLADPAAEIPRAQVRIRSAYLARATKLLEDGSPAKALACLNRILADDKQDADALALLAKAQGELEADAEVATDPARPIEIPADVDGARVDGALVATPRGATPLTGYTRTGETPRTGESTPPTIIEQAAASPARTIQKLGLVAAAFGLIGAAVVVATRFDDGREKKPVDPPPVAIVHDAPEDGTSTGEPAAVVHDDKRDEKRDEKRDDKRDDKKKRDGTSTAVKVVEPVVVTPPALATRPVLFRAFPFGDLAVDEQPAGMPGQKEWTLELAPGRHTAVFSHPSAKPAMRAFEVPASGDVPSVAADFDPLPATLIVECNQPDALVTVGESGGATKANAPRTVPVDKRSFKSDLEVTVYKKGFVTFTKKLTFRANEKKQVPVVLDPVPSDPAPAPAP